MPAGTDSSAHSVACARELLPSYRSPRPRKLWAVIAFAPSVLILATGSAVGALAALPLGIAAFPIWVS